MNRATTVLGLNQSELAEFLSRLRIRNHYFFKFGNRLVSSLDVAWRIVRGFDQTFFLQFFDKKKNDHRRIDLGRQLFAPLPPYRRRDLLPCPFPPRLVSSIRVWFELVSIENKGVPLPESPTPD